MVASIAPKRHHFSASSNLLSRVGCAVAQKNIGYSYTAKINESPGLSPSQILLKEAASRDTERKHQKVYTSKKENKLKKVQNEIRKKLDLSVREKHKGTAYKTAIAMSSLQYTIPVFTCPPELTRIHSIEHLVFCDIETSSLAKDTDILQLSACFGDETFNKYVVPCKAIAPAASRVTGLTTSGGLLFLDGSPVPAVPLKDALSNFVKWLQSIGQAVLVGHSFKVYVFPRLIRALRAVNLESEFLRSCVGSIDTLPIFKTIFPELETYKQTDLVEALLKETYTAHNAVEDVKSLKELFYFSNVPQELMIKFSFTTKWGFDNLTFLNQTTKNVKTMDALSTNKVVSKQMINTCRMTSSGLKYCDLVNV